MKISFKITLTALIITTFFYLSCKKSETKSTPSKTAISTADISKQIGLSLYRSLSSGLGTSTSFKISSTSGGLVTMDATNKCGEVVRTPTNKTLVSGDTTRKYSGNSIFTYMCNGYFNNNYNVDAYTLLDTLKTTETGTGFANNYKVTLNYVVKATDAHYSYVTIGGTTSTSSHITKVKAGNTTEYHDFLTVYQLNNIAAKRTGAVNPEYQLGRADFSTSTADKSENTNAVTANYSGYILFLPDHTARLYFKNNDGTYTVYISNLLTGDVTPA